MSSFRGIVIPVLVLVLFVAGAFGAYQVADLGQKDAARDGGNLVENETHVQQVGMWQLVDRSTEEFTAGFNDSVTVYNDTSTELAEGDDYEWNASDGAIFFYDTTSTSDGTQFTITYTYFQNTEGVKDLSGPLDVITRGVGQMGYFGAGIALIVFLLAFATIIGKRLGDDTPTSNR